MTEQQNKQTTASTALVHNIINKQHNGKDIFDEAIPQTEVYYKYKCTEWENLSIDFPVPTFEYYKNGMMKMVGKDGEEYAVDLFEGPYDMEMCLEDRDYVQENSSYIAVLYSALNKELDPGYHFPNILTLPGAHVFCRGSYIYLNTLDGVFINNSDHVIVVVSPPIILTVPGNTCNFSIWRKFSKINWPGNTELIDIQYKDIHTKKLNATVKKDILDNKCVICESCGVYFYPKEGLNQICECDRLAAQGLNVDYYQDDSEYDGVSNEMTNKQNTIYVPKKPVPTPVVVDNVKTTEPSNSKGKDKEEEEESSDSNDSYEDTPQEKKRKEKAKTYKKKKKQKFGPPDKPAPVDAPGVNPKVETKKTEETKEKTLPTTENFNVKFENFELLFFSKYNVFGIFLFLFILLYYCLSMQWILLFVLLTAILYINYFYVPFTFSHLDDLEDYKINNRIGTHMYSDAINQNVKRSRILFTRPFCLRDFFVYANLLYLRYSMLLTFVYFLLTLTTFNIVFCLFLNLVLFLSYIVYQIWDYRTYQTTFTICIQWYNMLTSLYSQTDIETFEPRAASMLEKFGKYYVDQNEFSKLLGDTIFVAKHYILKQQTKFSNLNYMRAGPLQSITFWVTLFMMVLCLVFSLFVRCLLQLTGVVSANLKWHVVLDTILNSLNYILITVFQKITLLLFNNGWVSSCPQLITVKSRICAGLYSYGVNITCCQYPQMPMSPMKLGGMVSNLTKIAKNSLMKPMNASINMDYGHETLISSLSSKLNLIQNSSTHALLTQGQTYLNASLDLMQNLWNQSSTRMSTSLNMSRSLIVQTTLWKNFMVPTGNMFIQIIQNSKDTLYLKSCRLLNYNYINIYYETSPKYIMLLSMYLLVLTICGVLLLLHRYRVVECRERSRRLWEMDLVTLCFFSLSLSAAAIVMYIIYLVLWKETMAYLHCLVPYLLNNSLRHWVLISNLALSIILVTQVSVDCYLILMQDRSYVNLCVSYASLSVLTLLLNAGMIKLCLGCYELSYCLLHVRHQIVQLFGLCYKQLKKIHVTYNPNLMRKIGILILIGLIFMVNTTFILLVLPRQQHASYLQRIMESVLRIKFN